MVERRRGTCPSCYQPSPPLMVDICTSMGDVPSPPTQVQGSHLAVLLLKEGLGTTVRLLGRLLASLLAAAVRAAQAVHTHRHRLLRLLAGLRDLLWLLPARAYALVSALLRTPGGRALCAALASILCISLRYRHWGSRTLMNEPSTTTLVSSFSLLRDLVR